MKPLLKQQLMLAGFIFSFLLGIIYTFTNFWIDLFFTCLCLFNLIFTVPNWAKQQPELMKWLKTL